jgi:hypothetical protein
LPSLNQSGIQPVATAEIRLTASKEMVDCRPMLLADGDVENFNGAVNELVDSGACVGNRHYTSSQVL